MLYLVLKLIHYAGMSLWFGASLPVAGNVRRALDSSPEALPAVLQNARRAGRVSSIAGWITILSGVALIFTLGGFGAVPIPIHIALTLALVMAGIGAFGLGGTVNKMIAAAEGGGEGTLAEVQGLRGRLAMFSGIFQGLWVLVLVLMVWRNQLM